MFIQGSSNIDKVKNRLEEVKGKKLVINIDSDRVIFLYPSVRSREVNNGYSVNLFNLVFLNKAKNIKIDKISYGYTIKNYRSWTTEMELGMEAWFNFKENKFLNDSLESFKERELKAFGELINGSIEKYLNIK